MWWKHTVRIDRILSNLNYCKRKEVPIFLHKRRVKVNGKPVLKAGEKVKLADLEIDGKPVDPTFLKCVTIAINKPQEFVCSNSRDGQNHQLVSELLPTTFKEMKPKLHFAGRLDKWASGLVIMSQDGKLVDRLIDPPKYAIGKVYEVKLENPLRGDEVEIFRSGKLIIKDDPNPLLPAILEMHNEKENIVRLTLFQGKYHQIRQMLAAVGNTAVSIHRVAVGPVELGDLKLGEWRSLTEKELLQLTENKLAALSRERQKLFEPAISEPQSPLPNQTPKVEIANKEAEQEQAQAQEQEQEQKFPPKHKLTKAEKAEKAERNKLKKALTPPPPSVSPSIDLLQKSKKPSQPNLAEEFNMTEEELRKKIQYLRERYGKPVTNKTK